MKNITFTRSITDWQSATAQLYFREIKQLPVLSEEEERELLTRMAQGDREAADRLVTANLRLVLSVANRYRGKLLSFMDLVQEGNLGLLRAAQLYRLEEGTRFSTYAVLHIRKAILSALSTKDALLQRPQDRLLAEARLMRFVRQFEQKHDRLPSAEEAAEETGLNYYDVASIFDNQAYAKSLDAVPTDGDADAPQCATNTASCLTATDAPTPVQSIDHDLLAHELTTALDGLIAKERHIVASLYGVDGHAERTATELADEMGLSPRRIRQVAQKALRQLHQQAADRLSLFL